MFSLQHLAVLKLMETQPYDGNDPVIENVIFEAEQIRNNLEDELVLHHGRKPRRGTPNFEFKFYNELMGTISTQLFDVFTYEDLITTREHVVWKEYFQTLYEFTVIDMNDSFYLLSSTLKHYDELEEPPMVDYNDPCYSNINYINNLFMSLRAEQEVLATQLTMKSDFDTGVDFGMKRLGWTQEWKAIHDRLDVYTRIIEWSLR